MKSADPWAVWVDHTASSLYLSRQLEALEPTLPDAKRQHWMSVLARADEEVLAEATAGLLPEYVVLRGPEAGLVMLRGRLGGSGQAFNVGETSVVRCTVRSELGHIGHAYCLGRRLRLAELAAASDAGLQDQSRYSLLYERVIAPLEVKLTEVSERNARRAAATQVQFFTMGAMRT